MPNDKRLFMHVPEISQTTKVREHNREHNAYFFKEEKPPSFFLRETSIVFPIVFPDAFRATTKAGETDALRNDRRAGQRTLYGTTKGGETGAFRNNKGRKKKTLCKTTKGGENGRE